MTLFFLGKMAELDKETDHDLSESCSSDTSAKRRRLLDHAESLPDEPEGEMLLPGPMTLTGEHGAVPHAETGEHGAEPHAESPSADEGSVHGEEPWSLERLAFSFESVEDMKDSIIVVMPVTARRSLPPTSKSALASWCFSCTLRPDDLELTWKSS